MTDEEKERNKRYGDIFVYLCGKNESSALRRKESRGLHYVVEYPDRVEEERMSTILAPIDADDETSDISSSSSIEIEQEEELVKQVVVVRGPR